jgi:hypothetical protein
VIRLARRQISIFILISLFSLTLPWFDLLPGLNEANQIRSFSPVPSKESPSDDSKSYQTPWLLWQDNLNEIAFLQNAKVINRNREITKNSEGVWNKLYYNYHKTATKFHAMSFSIIDIFAFIFLNSQACLHLDISPPYTPASL